MKTLAAGHISGLIGEIQLLIVFSSSEKPCTPMSLIWLLGTRQNSHYPDTFGLFFFHISLASQPPAWQITLFSGTKAQSFHLVAWFSAVLSVQLSGLVVECRPAEQ